MGGSGAQGSNLLSLMEGHSERAFHRVHSNPLLFSLPFVVVVNDIFDNYLITKKLQKSRLKCYIIFNYWLGRCAQALVSGRRLGSILFGCDTLTAAAFVLLSLMKTK